MCEKKVVAIVRDLTTPEIRHRSHKDQGNGRIPLAVSHICQGDQNWHVKAPQEDFAIKHQRIASVGCQGPEAVRR